MFELYSIAAFWFSAAIISTIIANRLKLSIALVEILTGTIIGYVAFKLGFYDRLSLNDDWFKFCAGTGAILLTFLSGTELNPDILKSKFKEIILIGTIGFLAPFIGATVIAKFIIGWNLKASLLTGIALSTTSMAVVYAVMIEYGFNKTKYGKSILGACFVNDLATVIGLGLIFAPFTYKTIIFIVVTIIVISILPSITNYLIKKFAYKTAAIRTKWIIFVLFSMGMLALWSGSEPVLPAYIIGIALARTIEKDNFFIRRLRTMTVGFLTPLYFLRAGAYVSIPALISAPLIFVLLFLAKVLSKFTGIYPVIKNFKYKRKERIYYTLLMSTGLTFGTISALYGLSNNIINQEQYSIIVSVVIASAVIPTIIANKFFLPKHLLEEPILDDQIPEFSKQNKKN